MLNSLNTGNLKNTSLALQLQSTGCRETTPQTNPTEDSQHKKLTPAKNSGSRKMPNAKEVGPSENVQGRGRGGRKASGWNTVGARKKPVGWGKRNTNHSLHYNEEAELHTGTLEEITDVDDTVNQEILTLYSRKKYTMLTTTLTYEYSTPAEVNIGKPLRYQICERNIPHEYSSEIFHEVKIMFQVIPLLFFTPNICENPAI